MFSRLLPSKLVPNKLRNIKGIFVCIEAASFGLFSRLACAARLDKYPKFESLIVRACSAVDSRCEWLVDSGSPYTAKVLSKFAGIPCEKADRILAERRAHSRAMTDAWRARKAAEAEAKK